MFKDGGEDRGVYPGGITTGPRVLSFRRGSEREDKVGRNKVDDFEIQTTYSTKVPVVRAYIAFLRGATV